MTGILSEYTEGLLNKSQNERRLVC
jgi:hypothetical protein